jgi:hypothetical protein
MGIIALEKRLALIMIVTVIHCWLMLQSDSRGVVSTMGPLRDGLVTFEVY